MFTKKNLLFLLFIFLFSAANFAAEKSTQALQLAHLLDSMHSLEANFSEVTIDSNQVLLQKSEGEVMLKRPGKFRWETKNPTHQIVLTNGNTLWVYDVDLAQVTRQSLNNLPTNPAQFLSGDVDTLLKKFSVRIIPHKQILVFQLIPKQKNKQFTSVVFSFQHDELHSMQIETTLNQVSTFTFSNIKMNPSLPDSLFNFKAPKGVDVLR